MTHYNQTTKRVTVAKTGGKTRVWDNMYSTPVKNLSIIVRLSGSALANIDTEVFFGGHFEDGSSNQVAPYTEGSIHKAGASQGTAAAIASSGTEAAHIVYSNTKVLPANNYNMSGGVLMPVVIEITNGNAADVVVDVTFVSESISSSI